MFLCACGNYCGQWDKLQNIITPSKIKKSSKEPDIQQNTAKLTNETLQKIRDSTYQLKTLPEDEFSEILKDFALPVCLNVVIVRLVIVYYRRKYRKVH